jgi:biopolymer transport protein ExbD
MVTRRRPRPGGATLEVTAFINLIVVLVPFLLSTAVFSRLAVQELALPAQAAGPETVQPNQLQLEIVIRADRIDVADRLGGLIGSVPGGDGRDDLAALGQLVRELKGRFPDQQRASVLAEPLTRYERIVQVMDVVRAHREGASAAPQPLFPDIAVGDAPAAALRTAQR